MRKIILILLILSLSSMSFAAPLGDLESESLAISLVIDTSGSMRDTDPQRLRQTVAEVFIDYLHPEDYLGIVTFSSDVNLVIPMTRLDDDGIRDHMKENLSDSLEGRGDTDYQAALEEANRQLQALNDDEARKIIIFLTDGEPDPDPANFDQDLMEAYMDDLWETVSLIGTNGFPVYSIGFTDDLDVHVLNRIAYETSGSVMIYQDVDALDENLVQLLQSRESIVEEIIDQEPGDLRPGLEPRIVPEFWLSSRGYRTGDEALISGSLMAGTLRVRPGLNLTVDSFDFMIKYDDGREKLIPLFDSGLSQHSDVAANDGIWSNRVTFEKIGTGKAYLFMTGSIYDEALELVEPLGDLMVADPGFISVTGHNIPSWIRSNENLKLSISLENKSEFLERVSFSIDEDFGTLSQTQVDLEPNSVRKIDLEVYFKDGLGKGIHDFTIEIKAHEDRTGIDKDRLAYSIDLLGSFEAFSRGFLRNSNILLPIVLIVIGLPLLIFFLGLFFYLILLRRHFKVTGTLRYWKDHDPENWEEVDLSRLRKRRVIISFNREEKAHHRIENSSFNYSLEIFTELIIKRPAFILGWKALTSRKSPIELIVQTSQPGIIQQDGSIFTRIYLYDNDVFSSGDYSFKYSQKKSRLKKKEGKNLLEGRV